VKNPRFAPALVSAPVLALALACGASGSKNAFDDGNGSSGGSSSGDGTSSGGPGLDAGLLGGDVGAPPTDQVAVVYGHSADTLYKLDPNTKAVTVVGDFSGCSSVVDIALDESSKLFGTTSSGLWQIDTQTAACTQIAAGSYPNSLSFVPKGTLDPNAEALVGYVDGDYIRIDTSTGQITNVGSIGNNLRSSGDIVSVKSGPTYLTVKGSNCNDCLIEVDPKTGSMVKNIGSIKHTDVFGLAFWAGTVYGFDNAGDLFQVTINGSQIQTSPITVPNAPSSLSFWGAGSTTSAPVTPTK
jgi:hypothetical protein